MFKSPSECSSENQKKKSLFSCLARSPGHMKVKVTLAALLSEGFLFHLEEIFSANPLPVARFEHTGPYVVFRLGGTMFLVRFRLRFTTRICR